jgi:DNA-binding protein
VLRAVEKTKTKTSKSRKGKIADEARGVHISKAEETLEFLRKHANGHVRITSENQKELEEIKALYKELGEEQLVNRIEFRTL